MPPTKRLRAPLIASGVIMAAMAFAGPAQADTVYPPPAGTQVLGTGASSNASTGSNASTSSNASAAEVSSATATSSGLAFTGTNAIGIGALGGLLVVGGATMVLVARRRKADV